MANRYEDLIAHVFHAKREKSPNGGSLQFTRDELIQGAEELDVTLPKNVGDVIYAFRFRSPLPKSIGDTAEEGKQWVIRLAGRGIYRFEEVDASRVEPSSSLIVTKVPDATPEIIGRYALGDEQALLAKVRYNRLIDVFLGVAAYSLQNHLRTTVEGVGQIEIDEVYVAVDRYGVQYLVPVQAKGGRDQIGVVQAEQDLAWCRSRYPDLTPRAVAAQFMQNGVIAMFHLAVQEGCIRVVQERHYELVSADSISAEDLALYGQQVNE